MAYRSSFLRDYRCSPKTAYHLHKLLHLNVNVFLSHYVCISLLPCSVGIYGEVAQFG